MRQMLFVILFFISLSAVAQDKLFMRDGRVVKGELVSIASEKIFFRTTGPEPVVFNKADVLLIETITGVRHIIGKEKTKKIASTAASSPQYRNILGLQPLDIFFGRATLNYERISPNGKIGWMIPLSLTFDPSRWLFRSPLDSIERSSAIGFITGLDMNFYPSSQKRFKFYFGPRFRIGNDIYLGEIQAYTLQTQLGWRTGGETARVVQHLSFGFGFVSFLVPPAIGFPKNQFFGWYSVNYRVSFRY